MTGAVFADDLEDVSLIDHGAGVIEQSSVNGLKEFAIPFHDDRKQLSDFYDRIFWHQLEDTPQGEPKAQSPDQDARLFTEVFASELRHRLLRKALRGTHEWNAIDLEEIVAVMLLEEQRFTIRSGRGG